MHEDFLDRNNEIDNYCFSGNNVIHMNFFARHEH